MCIFTGRVYEVAATRIFARMARPGTQALAYQARVGADRDVAMVLALPVDPRAGDDAVRFVDLSGASDLFARLSALFPRPRVRAIAGKVAASRPLIEVVEVGDYEASFVPTGEDFARLDPRFRLSQRLVRALAQRGEYGYAVFKVRASALAATRHPLGLTFRTAERDTLFFPTVHVHDRTLPERAHFDHVLYAQGAAAGARAPVSRTPDRAFARATRGVVSSTMPVIRRVVRGERANADVRMELAGAG
jgi:hypothetical protein